MSESGSGERPAWTGTIPEPVMTAIEAVAVYIGPVPAGVTTEAGEGWFAADSVIRAVRLVVAAWVAAVNGNGTALQALAELALSDLGGDADDGHDPAYNLLHPVGKNWVIAPGPAVTGIEVVRLDPSGDTPGLSA